MKEKYRHNISPRARVWLLGLLAALSGLCYYVLISMALNPRLVLVYDVKGATYGGPLTWPSRVFHLASLSRESRSLLFIFLVVAVSLMWFAAIYLVRRDNRKALTYIIVAGLALFALLFVFAPVFQSRDVFSYIFFGRAMTVYHSNPFLLIPHARPHDIFYPLVGWKYNASVYGPVFNYLAWIVTRVAGNSIIANIMGFKLMALAAYAACLPLVYTLTRRISPGKENMALAISAWCPLLVLHFLGGAHNDAVMVALVLAGFLLYRKGHLLWGIVLVLLATLVKIEAALILAPLLVLYIRDKQGVPVKRIAAAAGTLIGVTVLLYLPWLTSLKIFKTTESMSKMYSGASVPRLISWLYQKVLKGGGMSASRAATVANSRVHLLFLAVLAVVAVVLLLKVKDFRSMALSGAGLVLIWFLTSIYVVPWYLALGLVVAAITGWNLTTALLVGASAIFTFYRIPSPLSTTGTPGAPTVYIGLPFLLLLVGWLAFAAAGKLKAIRSSRLEAAPVDYAGDSHQEK